MFAVHYYNYNGDHVIDIANINESDKQYFEENDIKVSMEELRGEIIVYGCPYSDKSEESEVIVLANGRSCNEVLADLAETCQERFGDIRDR